MERKIKLEKKRFYRLDSCTIHLTDKAFDAYCWIHPLEITRTVIPAHDPMAYSLRGAFDVYEMTEDDVNGFLEELYDLMLRREDKENEN